MSQTPTCPKPLPPLFDLTGRVAILTGGAGLLGRQYMRALLAVGARVVVADLQADAASAAAQAAVDEVGGESLGIGVNVTRPDDVERMVATALDRWGQIDILINNAAIDPKFDAGVAQKQASTFEDYPLALWQQSLDVNLTGAFQCCQAVGREMVRQGRGVIVNVSSTYGVVAPDQRLYQRDGEAGANAFQTGRVCRDKGGHRPFHAIFGSLLGRSRDSCQHADAAWYL